VRFSCEEPRHCHVKIATMLVCRSFLCLSTEDFRLTVLRVFFFSLFLVLVPGYPTQEDFNKAFDKVKDGFLDIWSHLEPVDGQDENAPPTQFYDKNSGKYVTVELGEWDAIWWNGPKKIVETDEPSNVIWDYAEACGEEAMFYTAPKESKELTGLSYPWR
jgi:hypothetical protein